MTENNLNFANMSNGSSNQKVNLERSRHKVTGDVKDEQPVIDPKGVAKASPKFQPIEKEEEQDEKARAKALAEKTTKVPEK